MSLKNRTFIRIAEPKEPLTHSLCRRKKGAEQSGTRTVFISSNSAEDDGWQHPLSDIDSKDSERSLKTQVQAVQAKTILSRNQSPDLPFSVSLNPYQGCEHGCIYCYARPSHSYLELSPGLDFETRLFAKTNAAELLKSFAEARLSARADCCGGEYRCLPAL
jgi:hypothetical protein